MKHSVPPSGLLKSGPSPDGQWKGSFPHCSPVFLLVQQPWAISPVCKPSPAGAHMLSDMVGPFLMAKGGEKASVYPGRGGSCA